jgi:hypothetical protein
MRRLKTVTLDFAQKLIEEETGMPLAAAATNGEGEGQTPTPLAVDLESSGKRLITRDANRVPLFSELGWSEDAIERILRVPAGFMRDRTQARIEELAQRHGSQQVDLAGVEAGIELGLQTMAEMVAQEGEASEFGSKTDETRREQTALAGRCPAIAQAGEDLPRDSQEQPLNEVSQLAELTAMRMLLTQQGESGEE